MRGAGEATLVRQSVSVAVWTMVSRFTGLGRVLTIAAVLGPTYLGNIFEAVNLIPVLAFELFTGAVLRSLLVPPLTRSLDKGSREETERLAGSFLGLSLTAFAVVTVLGIMAGPLLLRLLTFGVEDTSVAEAQRQAGVLLLVFVMPQVLLYGTGGVGAAVLNAHGRFAIAAAAPALENLGLIATMGLLVVIFGPGGSIEDVSRSQIAVLGFGSTAAVALHAGAQWFWARQVAVRLVPRGGWRRPEVAEVVGRALPSLGNTALNVAGVYIVLSVANGVAGGVVAYNTALYFVQFPLNVVARPLSIAALPMLSRLAGEHDLVQFRNEVVRITTRSLFFVVPAIVGSLVLSAPLARAIAFGEMARPEGVTVLAAALASLSLGGLSEAVFVIATNAHYALDDATSPFLAMVLRTALLIVGALLASTVEPGPALIIALGLVVSVARLSASVYLARRLGRALPRSTARLAGSFLRSLLASAALAGPAYFVTAGVSAWLPNRAGQVAGLGLGVVVGITWYCFGQWVLGSPELRRFIEVSKPFVSRHR